MHPGIASAWLPRHAANISTYWEDLRIRGELHCHAIDSEEQALQARELRQCKPQETRRGVWDSTSRGLVALERVGGNEGECGAGVDDTGGFGEDVRGSAEADLLVDAPEFLRRIDCRDWSKNVVTGETALIRSRDPVESSLREVNRTDELARVGAAEGDLAVYRTRHRRGLE